MTTQKNIHGYTYGQVATSPITLEDLDLLKQTVLFTEEDELQLKKAGVVLADQTDDVLDVWYGFVDSHKHLISYFGKNSSPDEDYLNKVRERFKQWILDLCNRTYNQDWLNYQHEIALRHHSIKKNKTDTVDATPIVHFRYMVAFIFPITATIKPFLAKKGHTQDEVEAMHTAWFKAITLTTLLWCHPYINEGEF